MFHNFNLSHLRESKRFICKSNKSFYPNRLILWDFWDIHAIWGSEQTAVHPPAIKLIALPDPMVIPISLHFHHGQNALPPRLTLCLSVTWKLIRSVGRAGGQYLWNINEWMTYHWQIGRIFRAGADPVNDMDGGHKKRQDHRDGPGYGEHGVDALRMHRQGLIIHRMRIMEEWAYQEQCVQRQGSQFIPGDGRNGAQREGGDDGEGQGGSRGAQHRRKLQGREYGAGD